MITDTLLISYQAPDAVIAVPISVTGDLGLSLNVPIASNATVAEVDIAFKNSQLLTLVLLADQNMTLKSNSTSVPDNTVVLLAGVPKIFVLNQMGTNPFVAADVTKVYVNNTSLVAATLKFRALLDITP